MRVLVLAAAFLTVVSSALAAHASSVRATGAAATRPPVECPRLRPNVELVFGLWGGPGTLLRQREQFAAVGSWGTDRAGGYVIFAAATPRKALGDPACRRSARAPRPQSSALSPAYRYRQAGSNAFFEGAGGDRVLGELLHPRSVSALHLREPSGVAYTCPTHGRVTAVLRDVRESGKSVGTELRVFDAGRLLGVAVVRKPGISSYRISRTCAQT